jgi:hypothetical protein
MLNLKYHFYLLFILALLPSFCKAQVVYEGQIVNSVTEAPLTDATVTLKKAKQATASNNQGYYRFIVETPLTGDTLIFSFVGYKTLVLPVSAYLNTMVIKLEPVNNELAQVNINAGKLRSLTLEHFTFGDIKDIRGRRYYSTFPYHVTGLFAKQFQSPKAGALLTTIKLGRRDFHIPFYIDDYPLATSNKNTRFLIHVCTEDLSTGGPGKKIFTKEVNLTDNAELVTIDVSKEKIVLPDEKFFIAVEWLAIPFNEIVQLNIGEKVERVKKNGTNLMMDASRYTIMYQPFLVIFKGFSKAPTWVTRNGIDWRKENKNDFYNVALSATILY